MDLKGIRGITPARRYFPRIKYEPPERKFNVRRFFDLLARPGRAVANVIDEVTFDEGKNIPDAFAKGWKGKGIDPYQLGEKILKAADLPVTPVSKFVAGFMSSIGTDPITYVPIAKTARLIGTVAKKLPLVDDVVKGIKNLPIIDKATGAIKTAFIPNSDLPLITRSIFNKQEWLTHGQSGKSVLGIREKLIKPFVHMPKIQQLLASETIERLHAGVSIDDAIRVAQKSLTDLGYGQAIIEPATVELVKRTLKFNHAIRAREVEFVIKQVGRGAWNKMTKQEQASTMIRYGMPAALEKNIGYLARAINPEHASLINRLYPTTKYQGLSYILKQPSLRHAFRRSTGYMEIDRRYLVEAEKLRPGFLERIGVKMPLTPNVKISLSQIDKTALEQRNALAREVRGLGVKFKEELAAKNIPDVKYKYYTRAEINKAAEAGRLDILTEFDAMGNVVKRHNVKEFLVEDLPTIIAIRAERGIRAVGHRKFLDDVATQFGKTSDDMVKMTEHGRYFEHSKIIKNVLNKDLYFEKEIAQALDKMGRTLDITPEYQGLINYFDRVQSIWKWWTLVPIPAYHFRNAVGNTFLNYLADVHVDSYRIAAGIMRGQKGATGVRGFTFEGLGDEVAKWAVKGRGELAIEGTLKTVKQELYGSVGKKIQAFGTMSEDLARVANFVDGIVYKGLTPSDARGRVAKFLFDYTELTPFERNYMRRLFPFYTWLRKNLPLQVEQLAVQTGKFTSIHHALRGIESDVPDDRFIPRWFMEQNPVFQGTDEKGRARAFLLSAYLPIFDIQRIMGFRNVAQTVKSSLSPLIKAPLEFISNTSWFFNRAIEKHPGQVSNFLGVNMPNRIRNLMKNVRVLNELDKLNPFLLWGSEDVPGIFGVKKLQRIKPEFYARVLNVLSGIDLGVVDLEITKKEYLRTLNANIIYLKGREKIYTSIGDAPNLKLVRDLLGKYERQLRDASFAPVYKRP